MLNPFQIKGLHGSPPLQEASEPAAPSEHIGFGDDHLIVEDRLGPQNRAALVQLSTSEYDDIATNHPRARLTYLDEDDGDLITVGSSLELSQRLEEPASISARPTDPDPVHIFDIRRSNSVTELWRKYEIGSRPQNADNVAVIQPGLAGADAPQAPAEEQSSSTNKNAAPAPRSESESLMAAFEVEMARILRESNAAVSAQADTPSQPEPTPGGTRSPRIQNPADALLHTIFNLLDGAETVSAGVRSRFPELEQQLQNAQRALPGQVGSSVQVALSTLELQARNLVGALNNASTATGQRAENVLQSECPVAANTVQSLRSMASELGNMGQSLFETFESEFGCNRPRGQGRTYSGENSISPRPENREQIWGRPNDAPTTENTNQQLLSNANGRTEEGTVTSNPGEPFGNFQSHGHEQNATVSDSRLASPSESQLPTEPPSLRPHELLHPSHNDSPQRPPQHPAYHNLYDSVANRLPSPPSLPPPFVPSSPAPSRRCAPPRDTLFIGNVGYMANADSIRSLFESKDFLVDVELPFDAKTGDHVGFGYVYFPSIHAAEMALDALQGTRVDGHSINLEFSDHIPIAGLGTAHHTGEGSHHSVSPGFTRNHTQGGPDLHSIDDRRPAPLAVADLCSGDIRRSGGQAITTGDRLVGSSTSLDTERLNSLYPSLLPESAASRSLSNSGTTDRLPELTRDLDYRFPPVSQLDARLLAEQRQSRSGGAWETSTSPVNGATTRNHDGRTPSSHNLPSAPALGAPSGRPIRSDFARTPASERVGAGPSHVPNPLGRSNTFMRHPHRRDPWNSTHPDVLYNSDQPLRRRATERHSPRGLGGLHSRSAHNNPSAPHLAGGVEGSGPQQTGPQQRMIDECMSTLVALGYGSVKDGGPQRLAIYAAAADGNIEDAIEMIEEERKVYEQQGSRQ
ncbi:RNA recognition motif domain-containing protein [Aspergillus candidus]|uniref:RRM domain-containing protein n=1 Tax=Aspergillus candidus TaxID=41067 RepID=A0A2I2FJM6_ASPCN|nr:hypothetical protein BDW47DRAFT_123368 [Aspergillus candidus]PLB40838.1 hypothetical protein BDW47DRAFT_123368 [Aspergillus candidus]